jgi:hypothetical protein
MFSSFYAFHQLKETFCCVAYISCVKFVNWSVYSPAQHVRRLWFLMLLCSGEQNRIACHAHVCFLWSRHGVTYSQCSV